MADFGKAGTVTVHNGENDIAALVDGKAGQYLYYKLTVSGAKPIFTYAYEGKAVSEHQFPGDPKAVYQWTWGRQNGALSPDIPNFDGTVSDDSQGVGMSFITAIAYTLVVEQRLSTDTTLRTIKDVEYASQSSKDNFTSLLRVFTK